VSIKAEIGESGTEKSYYRHRRPRHWPWPWYGRARPGRV